MNKIYLYNTLTRQKEEFKPIKPKKLSLYTCGPTVYNYAHIGNLRTYIFEDFLKRTFLYLGYKVKQIENITDVGHLVSDADSGEDKMMKALERENLKPAVSSLMKLADKYTKAFIADTKALNILQPDKYTPATKYIKEMIALIKKIEENGYAYQTDLAVYFDVNKFKDYGLLSGQKLEDKIIAARDGVVEDPDKKHPADFALWFKLAGVNKNHIMHWPSPWGEGFPGWHIECSAMSIKYLSDHFDIHCGGIDHIPVHHTNELAQNRAGTGHQVVNVWSHGEFLTVDSNRMGKSAGNFITLQTLLDKDFNPLAYRYLALQTHYRQKLNFSWDSLTAAQNALYNLYDLFASWKKPISGDYNRYRQEFIKAISDDLNMPKALAVVWNLVKDQALDSGVKKKALLDFDQVLGLGLNKLKKIKIPIKIKKLAENRLDAKNKKDWPLADKLRNEIESAGYLVEDTADGYLLKNKRKS
ncbi:MAG: cysteine--tRNA ligase [Candidatus Buchananbacteria bacterium]|nr:cysteine--tRNA ligase [Candidatus Buchananbacteria bacterium]